MTPRVPPVPVIVLGMHRSGTSAVTGVLASLGVDLGSELLPSAPSNERGHFENTLVLQFHERMLRRLGRTWLDLMPLPRGPWADRIADEAVDELALLLAGQFGSSPLWAVKDPRTPQFLPIWLGALRKLALLPAFLIVLRDPSEVEASLWRRDAIAPELTRHAWLRTLLAAEAGTRGFPRTVVSYGALLADWRGETRRVADRLGLTWPRSPGDAAAEVDAFLSPLLRHHHGGDGSPALRDAPTVVVTETLAALTHRELDEGETRRMDSLRREHDRPPIALDGSLAEYARTAEDLARRGRELEERCARFELRMSSVAHRTAETLDRLKVRVAPPDSAAGRLMSRLGAALRRGRGPSVP